MQLKEALQAQREHPELADQAHAMFKGVLARSATDPSFRQQLLTDPRVAIASYADRPLSAVPQSFNVKFIENKADATIVLPDAVDPTAELSDAELEAVAGGSELFTITLSLIAASVALYTVLKGNDPAP